VLCHLTSLAPGTVERFLDFMVAAGLKIWQVLPLHPTDRYRSPYNGASVFALNQSFGQLLPIGPPEESAYGAFCERNSTWLPDFTLYQLASARFGPDWRDWPEGLRFRRGESIARLGTDRDSLAVFARQHFAAEQQLLAVRRAASDRGILLFGDMPLYPSYLSADVWASPALFDLNDDLSLCDVAGVPPDYFSATGQLWGNPVYDWAQMARDGYAWWVRRVQRLLELLDVVRIDHFRGLSAYWAVPAEAQDASAGAWCPGPGHALLDALAAADESIPLVAEDLGIIDADVEALRDDYGLPGMRVLQFAFSGDSENPHLPANYPEGSVAYTGTHDNDTSAGWYARLDSDVRAEVDRMLGTSATPAWRMIAAVFRSRANTAIVPMQDFLELGSRHRMNTPGTRQGNWRWQLDWDLVRKDLAARIRSLVERDGR